MCVCVCVCMLNFGLWEDHHEVKLKVDWKMKKEIIKHKFERNLFENLYFLWEAKFYACKGGQWMDE